MAGSAARRWYEAPGPLPEELEQLARQRRALRPFPTRTPQTPDGATAPPAHLPPGDSTMSDNLMETALDRLRVELAAERREQAEANADTRTIDDLRIARTRGEHVTQAMFREATAREEAQFERALVARRAAREADPDEARFARAEERAAYREQARADAEQVSEQVHSDVDRLRLARQERRTPGGPALTRPTVVTIATTEETPRSA